MYALMLSVACLASDLLSSFVVVVCCLVFWLQCLSEVRCNIALLLAMVFAESAHLAALIDSTQNPPISWV